MSLNSPIFNKFNEICRTCLKGGQFLTYLFDEENSVNLVKKLITCTALQFDKNDQMPNKICPTCIEELLQAFNFINKCQLSDATLKKYLMNQSVIKIEDTPSLPEPNANEQQQKQIKMEVIDDVSINENEQLIDDNITIKDEFSELMVNLNETPTAENTKKRKRDSSEFNFLECSVNLSAKKTDDDFLLNADKLNSTFSGQSTAEKSTPGRSKYVRKTHSEYGKENFTDKKIKLMTGKERKRTFICPICPKRMWSATALLKHFQYHTETANGNELKLTKQISQKTSLHSCQICKETFKKAENLINHYSQHVNSSKCEFCNKLYNSIQLRKHIRSSHKGAHPFNCDFCTKKFPNFAAKQLHQKQCHSADKSHKCAICSYTFDTLTQLYSHEIEHVGKAPAYNCQNCGDVFDEAHSLIKHKIEQKCGKFYECTDCFKVFATVKDRNIHKLKEHN